MITLMRFTSFKVTCPFNDSMVCRNGRKVNFNSLKLPRFNFEIGFAVNAENNSACYQALQ